MVETTLEFDQASNTEGICYLNHAKEATLSPKVRLAGLKALQTPAWEAPDPSFFKSRIRQLFASLLIGAAQEDIAIVASTSFAMTLAANNIARTHAASGGKIVLVQDQMCSQVYPWQKLVKDDPDKFELVVVEPNDDDITKAILDCLDDTVIVVAVSPLHWSHGALVDLDAISSKCQALTIHLIVDGTQSIGIVPPMDVTRLQPSLIACSTQKWLRAPPGLSLVYINKKLHDSWQPLDQHGRSRTGMLPNWNAHAGTMTPTGYPDTFFEDARKFDSGGNMTLIFLSMLRTSLTEVAALDVDDCQSQLKELMQPLLDWAVERDLWVPTHHANHLVGLQPANTSVDAMLHICNQLEAEGIFVSVRNSVFRISPYITNTPEDIQQLMDGLDKHLL